MTARKYRRADGTWSIPIRPWTVALPAVTLQLAAALEKANKNFDLLYLPNRTHEFFRGDTYYVKRMWDYFVEHLAALRPPEDYDLNSAAPAR